MSNSIFTKHKTISKDDSQLNGNYLITNKSPHAVIYLIHGLREHSGRFEQTAFLFSKQNYAAASIDFRSHGLSNGKQEHAKHINNFIEDNVTSIKACDQFMDTTPPKIIYGNSMGGILALKYALKNNDIFSSIILTAPWFNLTKPINKILLFTLLVLNYIYPKFNISSRIISSDLKSNFAKQEKAKNNNLVHKKISVWLFCFIRKLENNKMYCPYKLTFATLIVHAINKSITDSKASKLFCHTHPGFCSF